MFDIIRTTRTNVPNNYSNNDFGINWRYTGGVIMSTLVYSPLTEREYRNYKRKVRRQREIRNRIIFAVLSFLLILGIVFMVKAISSKAVEETDVTYKYFKSFEIGNDDTLWSIAKEHIDYSYYDDLNEYIDEVVSINHLKDNTIRYGQSIIIPYFSNEFH
jgi:hypothetical protein